MLHFRYIFLISTILLIFFSFSNCNKKIKSDIFTDSVLLKVTVWKKGEDTRIENAKIGIFDNATAYEAAINDKNFNNALQVFTSSLSDTTLFWVEPNKDYWILSNYEDTTTRIIYSNKFLSSKLNQFEESSEITFKVELEPVSGVVAFWTDPSAKFLPIITKINGVERKVSGTWPDENFPISDPKNAVYALEPGDYFYQAYTKEGCQWTGRVKVISEQVSKVQLDKCIRGLVPVTINVTLSPDIFPLYIYVDNNYSQPADTLYAPDKNSYICGTGPLNDNYAELYFEIGSGTHTYEIISANPTKQGLPNCKWSGAISNTIIEGCNPEIQINNVCN